MDTSEGETLHFIEAYGQRLIVTLRTAGIGKWFFPLVWIFIHDPALGPLLFLVYINYICKSCNQMTFYVVAGNTSLIYVDI